MINLTIDGNALQVKKGKTILEAALENGIHIPHLCYHPAIKPIGSCRICVVEVKPGPPRPQPACTTLVAEGMEVVTQSERLQKLRLELVKFILINHPLDCPWCDKGGECLLQDLTHELGIDVVDYEAVKLPPHIDYESPLVERYSTRCVTCGRCVRVCRDRVGASAINFEGRGYFTELGCGHVALNCEFCGTCIDICPVGALINKLFKYTARSWELTKTKTICPYCGGGCNYEVHTKNGHIHRVRSEESLLLCGRGRFGFSVVEAAERLQRPLIKKDGQLVEADWDEALNYAAGGLKEVIDSAGPNAVYGIGSPRATNEANYLFQKFFRVGLGHNNLDNPGRYNFVRALAGIAAVFGELKLSEVVLESGKKGVYQSPWKIPEEAKGSGFPFVLGNTHHLSQADVILVIGADVTPEMPTYGWRLMDALQKENFRLLVANPRKTKFDRYAHLSLRYQPGSERLLLMGLMEAVLEAQPGYTPHLEAEEFEDFKNNLLKTSLTKVAKQAGVKDADLRQAGKMLAQAQAPAIIFGHELLAQAQGQENATAVADLFLLIGQPCNKGSGLYPIAEKNNTHGVCDVGVLPNYLPGYQSLEEGGGPFAKLWEKPVPAKAGVNLAEMLDKLEGNEPDAPRALYLLGGDLVRLLPDRQRTEKLLQKVRFMVVQDAFLTDTARMADVVLPVAIHAELEGTYISTDGRLGCLQPALSANGTRPDWQIIQELSNRLGYPMNYGGTQPIFAEMAELMPVWAGIKNSHRWPNKKINASISGKFVPFATEISIPGEGKYTLLVGKTLAHSGSYTTHAQGPQTIMPGAALKINPADAQALEVAEGEPVRIISTQGEITVPSALTEELPPGVVFLADHFGDSPANLLTSNSNLCRVQLQKG
ncbi:MAG: molybdopterin-dependent oxidoreductase [Desulfobacteraceae bacterium]